MTCRLRGLWLSFALAPAVAHAQASRAVTPAPDPATLLERCTSVPDASACRAVLELRVDDRRRSLALTYLVEAGGEPRDSLLQEAVRRDSTNALAQLRLGVKQTAWYGPEATGHLLKARALRPDWTFLDRRIAESYRPFENGVTRPSGADSTLLLWRRAAQSEPDAAIVRVKLGEALLGVNRKPEAEAEFRRAIALEPELPAAVGGLCRVLLEERKVADADAPCRRAIRGWGAQNHGIDLRNLTWMARDAKAWALALASAEQGNVEEPGNYHRSDRTNILVEMGRKDEATRLLRQYVAAHPGDWDAVGELARLVDDDAPREAHMLYARLVAPACGEPRVDCTTIGALAVTSLRLGMADSAFRELHAALARQLDCPGTIEAFRKAAAARQDSAAVLARLRRELDAIGDTLSAMVEPQTAGRFFAASERWPRAEALFRIALDSLLREERAGKTGIWPNGVRWLYGETLVAQRRWCEAKRELEIVASASPGYAEGNPGAYVPDPLRRARAGCKEAN